MELRYIVVALAFLSIGLSLSVILSSPLQKYKVVEECRIGETDADCPIYLFSDNWTYEGQVISCSEPICATSYRDDGINITYCRDYKNCMLWNINGEELLRTRSVHKR